MFVLRFDMRAPSFGASTTDLYAAALEMAEWSETRGALMAVICEHHTMEDGYLPSPMVLATAMAARTTTLPIMVAVVILPLYEPVRLAEDMVVLDIISGGRVSYVGGVGYRPEEFEHHGVEFRRRGRLADEHLALLLRAKTGEPLEHEGRRIHVTPAPVTPGGPHIAWGGGSEVAVRRAGRFGLDFIGQGGDPSMEAAYAEEARAHGHEPGFCFIPPLDTVTTLFVAHDVDRAWEELGPHLLHDVVSYASVNEGNTHTASLTAASTVEQLRAENRSHRIVTVDEAVHMMRSGAPLQLQPLVGGLPPDTAWRYLRIITDEVMPAL